ncbi:helix-turn-helix domain-containing protein [Flagellimonas hymeniacidonis]|uniref:Helix-turn-helix domain-containing protein n=1 Tax=Flagellimonas hymeniacidonis TaxID=2603628 RepID=A0A5C8VAC5_9FLAO|nr:helix-turn-helix domain-containing protein [Flagellimonas hymeniacidonis]TXN37748.1 helix-turn-helix domain-containing protein [Flagellimonas hymeniacidonis]
MSKTVLYAYSKQDLEKIVEYVINKVRKTELISDVSVAPEEDRLTQQEACDLLGVTVQTLIKWKKKELIPYYQVGRSIFFSKKELLNIARNNPKLVSPTRM